MKKILFILALISPFIAQAMEEFGDESGLNPTPYEAHIQRKTARAVKKTTLWLDEQFDDTEIDRRAEEANRIANFPMEFLQTSTKILCVCAGAFCLYITCCNTDNNSGN